jgi:hypothetical protein
MFNKALKPYVTLAGKVRGRIFSHVRPFYERDVSNQDP